MKSEPAIQGFLLYRIYYGETLVYVGRTKQPLKNRIRGHLFAKPMHRTIAIEQVSKIEYAELSSAADMNLYELYYILLWKPPLNVDDKEKDTLSITLPELEWKPFRTSLWDKWMNEIANKQTEYERLRRRHQEYPENLRVLRSAYRMGTIDEDTFWERKEQLDKEMDKIRSALYRK